MRLKARATEAIITKLVKSLIPLGRRIKFGKGKISQLNVAPESNAKKVRFIMGKESVLSVSQRLVVVPTLLEEINVKYTRRIEYATVRPKALNITAMIN